jgi:hypothetical protein
MIVPSVRAKRADGYLDIEEAAPAITHKGKITSAA